MASTIRACQGISPLFAASKDERILGQLRTIEASAERVAATIKVIGEYRLHYEDGSTVSLPIAFGEDVRDWWTSDGGRPLARGAVAWTGANLHTEPRGIALRLCLSVWDNPHPEKQVAVLDFVSAMTTQAAPFCVALTVETDEPR